MDGTLVLSVRDGEFESEGQWVYAWVGPNGVVYVGATALHPATHTWLHLNHDDPEIARMAARYAGARSEKLDVVAIGLSDEVDRQQVRHSAVRLFEALRLPAPFRPGALPQRRNGQRRCGRGRRGRSGPAAVRSLDQQYRP